MLRDYDIQTYNDMETMLIEHGECCLIGIPGVGKTRISMHFIETYNLNALVITPRSAINDNWNFWGKTLSKGSISTITMHTFHTSYKLFASGFDIYVIDECHCLGAKEWSKTYARFKELINEK